MKVPQGDPRYRSWYTRKAQQLEVGGILLAMACSNATRSKHLQVSRFNSKELGVGACVSLRTPTDDGDTSTG